MVDVTVVNMSSDRNFMKRDESTGSADITMPAFNATSNYTITHNLGYIPFYQVFSEIDNASTIWSPIKLEQYTDTGVSGVYTSNATYTSWVTTTTLTISIYNSTSGAISGTRKFYWIIYKDYNV